MNTEVNDNNAKANANVNANANAEVKEVTVNKDSHSNNLMRKTKKDLVEIIFRKDDVEKQLRKAIALCDDDIAASEESINQLNKSLSTLTARYDTLTNDYRDICDEYATYRQEVKRRIRIGLYSSIGLILLSLIGIMFVLMY